MYPYIFRTELFSLTWKNLLIMVGILAAVWLSQRRSAHKGLAYQNMLLDLAIWLVPAGIIGARAWEMIFTWEEYVDTPWDRFAIWKGGLSIQGAVLAGLLVTILFARWRRVRIWELLDIIAPPVILGQAIGRIGSLMNGDAFGRPVSEVPWWPQWFGLIYHPESPAGQIFGRTPLIPAEGLEMAAGFLILAFLLWYRPRREVPGRTVLSYAILYSVARFLLEFLRADSLLIGGVKVAQLTSLAVILIGSIWLILRYQQEEGKQTAAG
ncbi:MAG: prolipoprotein diacylglyceryl transferase [Bacillota bacterium]